MSPNTRIFYRFLLVAAGINVVGLPIAVIMAEPWHATVHAALALVTGFWAMVLRHRHLASTREPEREASTSEEFRPELGSGPQAGHDDEWLKRQSDYEKQQRRE